jgi:hypothetical protein
MPQRELERCLVEVAHHFLERGYEDAYVFLAAALATPWDPAGELARAALTVFERERAFYNEDAAVLSRLAALLDDLAAMEEGEPA